MAWVIGNQQVDTPANPGALSDVDQLLERIVAAFGVRPTSKLLGVDGSTVSNWRSDHRRMSAEMRGRVVDLHDVLNRALLVFPADIAVLWLFGSEPFLDGKRPIDVLTIRGAAPLIDALRNIEAGAYAQRTAHILNLYRVLPLEPSADEHEAGGALFIPGSTDGRIDNVGVYKVLYLAREPEGAIAETYGRIPLWKPAMLKSASGVPHSLVTDSLPDMNEVFSLDDTVALASLRAANPSQIVARNRPFTQALALRIYERRRYIGVSWWNYYEPAWASFDLLGYK